jgi:hypothetical protein
LFSAAVSVDTIAPGAGTSFRIAFGFGAHAQSSDSAAMTVASARRFTSLLRRFGN